MFPDIRGITTAKANTTLADVYNKPQLLKGESKALKADLGKSTLRLFYSFKLFESRIYVEELNFKNCIT